MTGMASSEDYPSAAPFLPKKQDLPQMRKAVRGCRGCPLYRCATQAVFGEGPKDACFMLVGEQPGNEEDLQGHVFVGPAGRLLDKAMKDARLNRDLFYITNSVKHFKFSLVNDLRVHTSPGPREVKACKPWLEAEIKAVKPERILALGATAGKAMLGNGFRLTKERGIWHDAYDARVLATYHPSAVLRAHQGGNYKEIYRQFVEDLELLAA